MKASRALILGFAALVLTSTVAASPAELTIFPSESSTEINDFAEYQVQIENVGPVKDVYSLSSSSPAEVTVAPRQVTLEPQQEETIYVWYNPSETKEEGTYSFNVEAESRATGDVFSVEGTVNVIANHKVDVSVDRASRTACLGETVRYTVRVTNTGIQDEEFSVSTDFGQLSRNRLTLEDGETQTVTLSVSRSQEVDRNFNVVAASTTSYAQDIQNLDFKSETCYASDVSITPDNREVAAFTETEYEVTVRNTGTRTDEFVLSASEGELEDTTMDIEGRSSDTTTLSLEPEELGTRQITVTAESTVTSSATVSMNVVNGMDVSLAFDRNSRTVCETGTAEYSLNVENTGAAEDSYNISASRGNLSETELELEPGEDEEVELSVDARQLEEARTYNLDVTVASNTFDQPRKTRTASLRVENCWDLQMNVVPKVQSAGKNRSVIYEIRLTNPGTRQNSYNLSYEGPEWISIKPEQVAVKPGRTRTAFMYAGIPFQKKGEVRINVSSEGENAQATQSVRLLVDKKLQDAVDSDRTRGITGFLRNLASRFSDAVRSLGQGDQLARIAAAVVIGVLITAAVLLREW